MAEDVIIQAPGEDEETPDELTIDGLTIADVDQIWKDGEDARVKMTRRADYYDGEHDILKEDAKYSDGRDKTQLVTNWVEYIVKRFNGSFTTYQISRAETDEEEEVAVVVPADEGGLVIEDTVPIAVPVKAAIVEDAFDAYTTTAEREHMDAIDSENRHNALLFGYGVEVHSYAAGEEGKRDGKIKITNYDPREWVIVRPVDSSDIMLAIHRIDMDKGTIYAGEYLRTDMSVMTVYTVDKIYTFELRAGSDGDASEWRHVTTQDHSYGRVPVIQWRTDSRWESIISDAIIAQNDVYNELDSASGDDLLAFVDSILKIWGASADWVDKNSSTIREKRIIPFEGKKDEQDAVFLQREVAYEAANNNLARKRGQIHIMGQVPDTTYIVGTTGATSGIALKLLFAPMHEASVTMITYLKQGLVERIELMNAIWKANGLPELEAFTLTIIFRIPINKIEEWANISKLDGEVSHRTRLEMLTDIEDPEKELKMVREDAEQQRMDIELGEPVDAAAAVERQDRIITEQADAVSASLAPLIQDLSEQMTQGMIAAAKGSQKAVEDAAKKQAKEASAGEG